jgi:hypothetical protein
MVRPKAGSDPFPPALLERRYKRYLRWRVAGAFARENRDRTDPASVDLFVMAPDAKYRSASLDGLGGIIVHKPFIGGERHNQASTVLEALKPSIRGARGPRIYIDHVGGVKIYCCAIAVDHRDMWPSGRVGCRRRGKSQNVTRRHTGMRPMLWRRWLGQMRRAITILQQNSAIGETIDI